MAGDRQPKIAIICISVAPPSAAAHLCLGGMLTPH